MMALQTNNFVQIKKSLKFVCEFIEGFQDKTYRLKDSCSVTLTVILQEAANTNIQQA
jgi:hypothetical protein